MDSSDAAELIAELNEDRQEQAETDRFRSGAALMIAFLAAVLAIGGLGGGNATDDMIDSNIRASDTWAFFQAKNVRQTMYELALADLEAEVAAGGGPDHPRVRFVHPILSGRHRIGSPRTGSSPSTWPAQAIANQAMAVAEPATSSHPTGRQRSAAIAPHTTIPNSTRL